MKTGSVSGPPPPVSSDIIDDIVSASEKDTMGVNAPGQEGGDKIEAAGSSEASANTEEGKKSMSTFFAMWLEGA